MIFKFYLKNIFRRKDTKISYLLNFIVSFIAFPILLFTQNSHILIKLSDYEDTLKILSQKIMFSDYDFEKYEANEKMLVLFEDALLLPKSYEYSFDSLKYVSRLKSPDNSFKIYTWLLNKEDGTYEYFGIIHKKEDKNNYKIYQLIDNSANIESPETKTLYADNWYGALYYDIIYKKHNDKKFYTLLGWHGKNRTSTQKLIDILTFTGSKSKPTFGYTVFKNYNKMAKRVIFEYSATTSMVLRYERQYIDNVVKTNKKRKESNRKVIRNELKKEQSYMIVFDRLSPINPRTHMESPTLEGEFQYYVPETNIHDAFLFQNGKWVFVKDIDARNRKVKNPEKNKKVQRINLYSP